MWGSEMCRSYRSVQDRGSTLDSISVLGPILGGVLEVTLGLVSDTVSALAGAFGGDGVLDSLLSVVGDVGLVPIDTATGPNIMRVRYNEDENGDRTIPPVGYIVDTPDGPVFRITFDLLFDAPALSLPLGREPNGKCLPRSRVHILRSPRSTLSISTGATSQ